jgi:HSP20 family protein
MRIETLQPWLMMNRLQRLDQLFNLASSADESQQTVADWLPPVDIREQETEFVLHADLPGVDPKNIDVTLEKGVLTIRGNRQLDARDEAAGFRRVERVTGAFFRRFNLPDTADSQAVKARYANGVLEVVIPKHAQTLPRRVAVEAA